MTKLEAVFERLRQLPQAEQDILIADLEAALDFGVESPLSEAQWAEVQAELNNPNPDLIPHEQIVAEFEKKFGR